MSSTHTYNVCTNKGHARIWIERTRLIKNGFHRGMRFSKRIERNRLILDFGNDDNARHKIAGTDARPVIDLCGNWVSEFVDGATHYKAKFDIDNRRITISRA